MQLFDPTLRFLARSSTLAGLAVSLFGAAVYASFYAPVPASSAGLCAQVRLREGDGPWPSISINGRCVRVNSEVPATQEAMEAWTLFAAPARIGVGQPITFAEDRQVLARSLIPAAMRMPKRWSFGDGRTGDGWQVRHAYTHSGSWIIKVAIYDPQYATWYTVDAATLAT